MFETTARGQVAKKDIYKTFDSQRQQIPSDHKSPKEITEIDLTFLFL